MTDGLQIGVIDLAAGLDDFARKLDGGPPLRVAGMALPSENDFIDLQFGHLIGRKAVNRQPLIAAIHFGNSEAGAAARLRVEPLAQWAGQGGPELNSVALREGRHHTWRDPDALGEHIKGWFRTGRHRFQRWKLPFSASWSTPVTDYYQ